MFDQSLDLFGPHSPPNVPGALSVPRRGARAADVGEAGRRVLGVQPRLPADGRVAGPARRPAQVLRGLSDRRARARRPGGHAGSRGRTDLRRGDGRRPCGGARWLPAARRRRRASGPSRGWRRRTRSRPRRRAQASALRTQFAETAFWQPHLLTSADGTREASSSPFPTRSPAGTSGRTRSPRTSAAAQVQPRHPEREGADGPPLRPALPPRGRPRRAAGRGEQHLVPRARGHARLRPRRPGHPRERRVRVRPEARAQVVPDRGGEEHDPELRAHRAEEGVHGRGEGGREGGRALRR